MPQKEKIAEQDRSEAFKCRQAYLVLKQRYTSLPDYDSLNDEFEICFIEHEDFLLRSVIRKMAERLEGFAKMIEDVIQGDSTLSNMYEWKYFDEKLKQSVFETYRILMFNLRVALEESLTPDEKKEALMVKKLWESWLLLKPNLQLFIKEMRKAWEKDVDLREQLEYLG